MDNFIEISNIVSLVIGSIVSFRITRNKINKWVAASENSAKTRSFTISGAILFALLGFVIGYFSGAALGLSIGIALGIISTGYLLDSGLVVAYFICMVASVSLAMTVAAVAGAWLGMKISG